MAVMISLQPDSVRKKEFLPINVKVNEKRYRLKYVCSRKEDAEQSAISMREMGHAAVVRNVHIDHYGSHSNMFRDRENYGVFISGRAKPWTKLGKERRKMRR